MAVPGAVVKVRRRALHRALARLVLHSFRRRCAKARRSKVCLPLTQKQWKEAFDPHCGRLIAKDKVIETVRFGGIESNIRAEVWLYLWNFYDIESTEAEREEQRMSKRAEYYDLKRRSSFLHVDKLNKDNDDQSINYSVTGDPSSPALGEFSDWQRIIRLDAVRMDPDWVAYSPTQGSITRGMASQLANDVSLHNNEHLDPCIQHHAARLVAILEAYALYDPESGYCQGMGDLLSPFVALLEEDYQAFWCFAQFMSTARDNFRLDEMGIGQQLQLLAQILKVGDSQLYKYLEKIEAANCFFAYRMVVVLMRRELTFEQTIAFWEMLWAEKNAARAGKVKQFCRKGTRKPPSDDLLLFVVAASVCRFRNVIMENCLCMDDVLKTCHSMAGKLDIHVLLLEARKLSVQVGNKLDRARRS